MNGPKIFIQPVKKTSFWHCRSKQTSHVLSIMITDLSIFFRGSLIIYKTFTSFQCTVIWENCRRTFQSVTNIAFLNRVVSWITRDNTHTYKFAEKKPFSCCCFLFLMSSRFFCSFYKYRLYIYFILPVQYQVVQCTCNCKRYFHQVLFFYRRSTSTVIVLFDVNVRWKR